VASEPEAGTTFWIALPYNELFLTKSGGSRPGAGDAATLADALYTRDQALGEGMLFSDPQLPHTGIER